MDQFFGGRKFELETVQLLFHLQTEWDFWMDITSAISSLRNSYFKISLLCSTGSPYLFFIHQMEEEKGEDEGGGNGGQDLAMRESSWRATLVVMMNMLRYISYRDRCCHQG